MTVAPDVPLADAPALEMAGIVKSYGRVQVLKGVDFTVRRGQVHALVGQNGAGKSTLMKIVSGVTQSDGGTIRVNGKLASYRGAAAAREQGIGMVFQELSLVSQLTVLDNVWLGRERTKGPWLEQVTSRADVAAVLARLGVSIGLDADVRDLSTGHRQLVEIAKVLIEDPHVIVFDEPTASLDGQEIANLFSVIRRLRDQGAAIVYISHYLEEVLEIADWITTLRDGEVVDSRASGGVTVASVVEGMIGRRLESRQLVDPDWQPGPTLLAVTEARDAHVLRGVSLSVAEGEVLGIAGILGSGRTELLEGIAGLNRTFRGKVTLRGRPHLPKPDSPEVRLLAEDRSTKGLVFELDIRDNTLLSDWRWVVRRCRLIGPKTGLGKVEELMEDLRVKSQGPSTVVAALSGGNQQKVLLSRSLMGSPDVLLLDEPTAGIDVAAKQEILAYIRRFANKGKGVIVASSDLLELASMSDRVVVLVEGQVSTILDRRKGDEITESSLLTAIQRPHLGDDGADHGHS